jgi:hypothetical protein
MGKRGMLNSIKLSKMALFHHVGLRTEDNLHGVAPVKAFDRASSSFFSSSYSRTEKSALLAMDTAPKFLACSGRQIERKLKNG